MIYKFMILGIYILNIVTIFTVIFLERKNPTTTVAWVLVLVFIPGIGIILYLLFGREFKVGIKKRLKLKKELFDLYNTEEIKNKLHFAIQKEEELLRLMNSEVLKLVELNKRFTSAVCTADNSLEIFTNGKEKYSSLFEDIKKAKHSINAVYFSISNDYYGKKFLELLTQKAKEGLKVKLIYDAIGCFLLPKKLIKKLKDEGGEAIEFAPILQSLFNINYRTHRKIVVIDGTIAYTGGMNVGKSYASEDPILTPWRDTHVKVIGSASHSLQFIFYMDWYYVTKDQESVWKSLNEDNFPPITPVKNYNLQVVPSGPDTSDENMKKAFLKMIYEAKKSILIQTPYFIPDGSILDALQTASYSGVEVIIMFPLIPDHKPVQLASTTFIEPLLDFGIKIYLYKGFIHAKTITIDDTVVSIGTTNFDIRSFKLMFEVNLFIYSKEIIDKYRNIFYDDIKNCHKLCKEDFHKRGYPRRILESLTRLISPLF